MITIALESIIGIWIIVATLWMYRKSAFDPKNDRWYDYIITAPYQIVFWFLRKVMK